MDRIVFVGVLAVWLAGCSGPAPAPPPAAEPGITPIVGRSAATNIAMNLHVQKLIREGKLDEALSDLESTLPGHLALMHWAEPVMPASDVYFRLRDRDLRSLKQHWLEHPPYFVPDELIAYIDAACARLGDCVQGSIRPLHTQADMDADIARAANTRSASPPAQSRPDAIRHVPD
ncbi:MULTISPECIES: hypothetical protein [Lysobacteraceae]|nr:MULTISPECIES: hypothetical protein [Lysobacter]